MLRREFLRNSLKYLVATSFGPALTVGIKQGIEAKNIADAAQSVNHLWNTAESELGSWGSYTSRIQNIPGFGWGEGISYRVYEYNPAHAGQVEMRLAEGIIPCVRWVNDRGVGIFPEDLSIITVDKRLAQRPVDLDAFKFPSGSKDKIVSYNNKSVDTVVVRGDSWATWGGSIYSMASILQSFFNYEGFRLSVRDISALGVGVANFLGRAQREGWTGDNSLHIHCYQPDTDPTYDIWSLSWSAKQNVLAEKSRFSFHEDYPEDLWKRMIAAYKRSLLIETRRDFLAAILKIGYKALTGRPVRYIDYDRNTNSLKFANALAPLDPEGQLFFNQYKVLQERSFGEVIHSLVLGLPAVGLSYIDSKLYDDEVWPQLLQFYSQNGVQAINTNHLYRGQTDLLEHPTPEINFGLAEKTFLAITGHPPSEDTLTKAHQNMLVRIEAMKTLLINTLPGVEEDYNVLFGNL